MPVSRLNIIFAALLLLTAIWGYVETAGKPLPPKQGDAASRRQLAIDRLFGGDTFFDPAAEDVLTPATNDNDSISWKQLAKAKPGPKPQFDKELLGYEGRSVTITGYMFPLAGIAAQSHFLLSAYPPGCPYCLPAGPTELIDIEATSDIPFSYGPLTITGIFHPLQKPEETADGFLYRLTTAKILK